MKICALHPPQKLFLFLWLSHLVILALPPLPVATQIRGHTARALLPLAHYTVRAFIFIARRVYSAFFSLVDFRRIDIYILTKKMPFLSRGSSHTRRRSKIHHYDKIKGPADDAMYNKIQGLLQTQATLLQVSLLGKFHVCSLTCTR